jgi:hypothetical protein
MTASPFQDVSEIPAAISRLQRSSQRAAPLALLGLVLTLMAAGISGYYAFHLSRELKLTEKRLDETTRQLSATRGNLNAASASLKRLEASASKPAEQLELQRALADVGRGKQNLAEASNSLAVAATTLPSTSSKARWFTVIGGYPIGDEGLRQAKALADDLGRRGACAEIWRTQISRDYAVVLGGPTDANSASDAVGKARDTGLDIHGTAFTERDRGWTRVAGSRVCDAKG